MWRDRALIGRSDVPSSFGPLDAQRFAETLARRLGIDGGYANAAFEDPFYYLQRERELPINVDPLENHLEDPVERERVHRVFERGLNTASGYVLPSNADSAKADPNGRRDSDAPRRASVPDAGRFPMGLRLPLPRLPWVSQSEMPQLFEVDPLANRGPLPVPQRVSPSDPALQLRRGDDRDRRPGIGESAPWIVRTALCVEPRDGRLHVFMPPLRAMEDYIDLLSAIEDTAAHLSMPVMIEGYTPPPDSRINRLSVTPDPGIIEVNIQPANNWPELVGIVTAIHDDARDSSGDGEIPSDGRHAGTGGGNHFALGGATPSDSPFLRRPTCCGDAWHY